LALSVNAISSLQIGEVPRPSELYALSLNHENSAMSASKSTDSRFAFGENWSRFLSQITPARIRRAEESLWEFVGPVKLRGGTFLDVGSGSGLFSLAARNLEATSVYSFDYDSKSVECTNALREKFFPGDKGWRVEQGSAVDSEYMGQIGQFDIVYSWGVLHHTGNMWRAIELTAECVKPGGLLFLAIYNDQGGSSRRWRMVKRIYNRLPRLLRPVLVGAVATIFETYYAAVALTQLANPFRRFTRKDERGMAIWRDWVDWVGGYPFEVAKPEQVFEFCHSRGFTLEKLKTCAGGLGCNEYLFRRDT
jgi:2-polyprenyl-6-hydroxyphenyl methylase/3-demethylubiquinone-9 3-methyltransferase